MLFGAFFVDRHDGGNCFIDRCRPGRREGGGVCLEWRRSTQYVRKMQTVIDSLMLPLYSIEQNQNNTKTVLVDKQNTTQLAELKVFMD